MATDNFNVYVVVSACNGVITDIKATVCEDHAKQIQKVLASNMRLTQEDIDHHGNYSNDRADVILKCVPIEKYSERPEPIWNVTNWKYKGHAIRLRQTSFDRDEYHFFIDDDYNIENAADNLEKACMLIDEIIKNN